MHAVGYERWCIPFVLLKTLFGEVVSIWESRADLLAVQVVEKSVAEKKEFGLER